MGALYASCDSSANTAALSINQLISNSLAKNPNSLGSESLFSSKANAIALETPDLKLMHNNTLCGIATPCVVSGKVLGDAFGSNQNQKEIADYMVQPGDTVQSIADAYHISSNTIAWANDISKATILKAGQTLAILPVDGVLHIVKSGDTLAGIASKYKAQKNDVISFNNLASQDDIYIGDILIVPSGTLPKNASPINNNQTPVASNFFIIPAQGLITQGLHYYNAVDLANKCGTPVYAAASGTVERAVLNNQWNLGMGNYVTILHSNGTVTYYGHFENIFVKPGDKVSVGDRIGLMGKTGLATGCHVHFQVTGTTNPLAKYPVGTNLNYK